MSASEATEFWLDGVNPKQRENDIVATTRELDATDTDGCVTETAATDRRCVPCRTVGMTSVRRIR